MEEETIVVEAEAVVEDAEENQAEEIIVDAEPEALEVGSE